MNIPPQPAPDDRASAPGAPIFISTGMSLPEEAAEAARSAIRARWPDQIAQAALLQLYPHLCPPARIWTGSRPSISRKRDCRRGTGSRCRMQISQTAAGCPASGGVTRRASLKPRACSVRRTRSDTGAPDRLSRVAAKHVASWRNATPFEHSVATTWRSSSELRWRRMNSAASGRVTRGVIVLDFSARRSVTAPTDCPFFSQSTFMTRYCG